MSEEKPTRRRWFLSRRECFAFIIGVVATIGFGLFLLATAFAGGGIGQGILGAVIVLLGWDGFRRFSRSRATIRPSIAN
jgi:hypothetical protein